MNVLNRARPGVLAPVALALFLFSCADNPVGDDHDDEHAQATQILLTQGAVVLYGYDSGDGTVSCSIASCGIDVRMDEASTMLEVALLDEEGHEVHIGDLADEFGLVVEVAEEGVVTATIFTSEDEATMELVGIAPGATQLRVALLHGDEHEDLATPPLGDARAVSVRVVGVEP